MDLGFRQMVMDVWGVDKGMLSSILGLRDTVAEAVKRSGLDLINVQIAKTKDHHYRLLFNTDRGLVVVNSYPDKGLLMVDCTIEDESGTAVAVCEYIFRELGGATKLERLSSFFERGVKQDADRAVQGHP